MELFSVSVSDRPVSQRVISHARLSHRVSNLSFVCHIARHVCDMSYCLKQSQTISGSIVIILPVFLWTATYLFHCALKISTLIRMLIRFTSTRWSDTVGLH